MQVESVSMPSVGICSLFRLSIFDGGDTAGAQLLSSPPCSLVICQHSCTTGNQPVNLYDMFFHVW